MDAESLSFAAWYAEERATPLSLASLDHGPRHWRDVARIAHAIMPPKADPNVVFLFAALHDTQRQDEFSDPEHGERAARLARRLQRTAGIEITSAQMRQLEFAVRHHDEGDTCDGPTVGACWDADRLTLGRVGKVVDPSYLSLPQTRGHLSEVLAEAHTIMHSEDLRWEQIAALYEERMVRAA